MSERMRLKDVRHIVHVGVIIVVVIIGFLIARRATVPKSFGQYGHYRGKSIGEHLDLSVVVQSAETCKECHEDERGDMWPGFDAWQKGKHSSVTCENCHSNAKEHVERRRKDPTLEKFVITKDASPQRCLTCHFGLAAGPNVVPLCKPDENHAEYLKLLKEETEEVLSCTMCHPTYLPHNPKLAEKDDEG